MADGIIVDNYRQMAEALEQADALDPFECRRYVEELFAPERMVGDYERTYREAIKRRELMMTLSQNGLGIADTGPAPLKPSCAVRSATGQFGDDRTLR